MKDYAKLASSAREKRTSEREPVKAQAKPNLVKTAKELQPKEEEGSKNMFARVLILGILIIVGYGVAHQYLATHHIDLSTGKITTALKQAKNAAMSNNANAQSNTPQFDFYTVLPKGNAPANAPASSSSSSDATTNTSSQPAAQPAPAPTAPAPAAAPSAPLNAAPVTTIPVSTNSKYYLNVGNYPTNDAAQEIASDLSSMNINTSINPVQSGGATVYSVMAGPYPDEATMSIVRTQLSAHDINTTVVQSN